MDRTQRTDLPSRTNPENDWFFEIFLDEEEVLVDCE